MIKGGKVFYHDVLQIPEGKSGEYEIKHLIREPGCFPLANTRCVIFGQKPGKVTYDHPTKWHELSYSKGVWMTDLPIEQAQHDELLKGIRGGSVLVGGLGVGYAVTVLARKPRVKKITVVEISEDVIKLVADATCANLKPSERAKVAIYKTDLFDYLRAVRADFAPPLFDYAFYDIWQSDSEGTFFDVVVPLIQLGEGIVKYDPVNWNEGIMRGQLLHGLVHRMLMSSPKWKQTDKSEVAKDYSRERFATPLDESNSSARFFNWSVEFFRTIGGNDFDERLTNILTSSYVKLYGRPDWQAKWRSTYEAFTQSSVKSRTKSRASA